MSRFVGATRISLSAPQLHCRKLMHTDPDVINRYFELLEQTIVDNNLLDKPCQIFNVDESGVSLDPKSVMSAYKSIGR